MDFNFIRFFNRRQTPREQVTTTRRPFMFSPGLRASEETAMKVSAFYRGVIYIATQIAKLPWDVKDNKNNVLDTDRIYYLLNLAPNPEMNSFSFRTWLVLQAIQKGNAYVEIERDNIGRPINLWPIVGHVEPVRVQGTGDLKYRVTGASMIDPGADVYLDPKDVFHAKNFHTKDGIVGQGLIEYAQDTLGIQLGADRMASGLFANSGMPSGVLTHPGKLGEDAYNRLKESWRQQNSGAKAGSVAILEEGMKFEPLNMDPEVLQFLESRKFGVVEIARFLGLPPWKLFDTGSTTYSNVENANLEVATDTLDAWATNLEMEADVKLLSGRFGGKYTQLDLYSVFRGDMDTRATYFGKMMQVAAMSPAEIRDREGLPAKPELDRLFVATNNYTPIDRMDEVIDSQIQKNEGKAVAQDLQNNRDNQELAQENATDPTDKALKAAALKILNKHSQG